ncbi:MAG: 3-deoxy-8-phosphooctulonate synthase [Desulfovibrio sp.]|jgi:2-dehydro-3-deoxyphosphooctonate aldolase (KDO 8-P synthase)|nr:3-deoxy-8-phosphooctulonate synthase [Desulfovibrio sp.]
MAPRSSADALYAVLRSRHFFIAGPCVLESCDLALHVAAIVKEAAEQVNLPVIFKSSYEKANRTSGSGFRGPGRDTGLVWLDRVREETDLPVTTDVHDPADASIVAEVVDILQIPAFLSRQTALLTAAGETGAIVNVKKGQFLAPWDMAHVAAKIASTGNSRILLTERGSSFGYNNLVVDMRSFPLMKDLGYPLIMDATHSVQMPGGQGACSGGDRRLAPPLALAAAGAGAAGVFLECHPHPDKALCDGPNSLNLADVPALFRKLAGIWRLVDEQ